MKIKENDSYYIFYYTKIKTFRNLNFEFKIKSIIKIVNYIE